MGKAALPCAHGREPLGSGTQTVCLDTPGQTSLWNGHAALRDYLSEFIKQAQPRLATGPAGKTRGLLSKIAA